MKINLTKDPLRLILGVLSLIHIDFPFSGLIFTIAGIVTGLLLLLKTRYL